LLPCLPSHIANEGIATGLVEGIAINPVHQTERFLEQTHIVWTTDTPDPAGPPKTLRFPFSFKLPLDELPPSFASGDDNTSGLVQYYVHAVAKRKSWLKQNFRVDKPFLFLPVDRGLSPYLILPHWPGQWQAYTESKKVRKGLFSRFGRVDVEVSCCPHMRIIRLFTHFILVPNAEDSRNPSFPTDTYQSAHIMLVEANV